MRTIESLHTTLRESLDFPDYYGANLDALWDCLTDFVDEEITLEWVNFAASRVSLGEYAEKVLAVLQDAEKEVDGFSLVVR